MRSDVKEENKYRPVCARCRRRTTKYKWYGLKCLCRDCYKSFMRFKEVQRTERDVEYKRMLRMNRGLTTDSAPIQTDT